MSRARPAHARSVAVIATVLFALLCLTAADGALATKKASQEELKAIRRLIKEHTASTGESTDE